MGLPKWLVGTTDGKNFIISTDRGDMPTKGAIIPVHEAPTQDQIKTLEDQGCKVRVIYPTGQSNAR